METIVYNGDQEIIMSTERIALGLPITEVMQLYGTTIIYRDVLKVVLSENNRIDIRARKQKVDLAIEVLCLRLLTELGEDEALSFMASTSLSIILSEY